MFNFSLIVILAGFMILAGIAIWTRQRRQLGDLPEIEQDLLQATPKRENKNAVLVAQEYGKLVYINEQARAWLGVRSGLPDLEYITRNAQPAHLLQGLFTHEGVAAFNLAGRWVEGNSQQILDADGVRFVVTLRELSAESGVSGAGLLDVSTSMRILADIGEDINPSMGIEPVLQSILSILAQYIDIDAGEICLYDPQTDKLYQRGWLGDAAYVLSLALEGGYYNMGEGITGWVASQRQSVLVADTQAPDALKPKLADNPYGSFVAVPLVLGERLLGTLELCQNRRGYFSERHLVLLEALSKSVATAIQGAELYAAQNKRIDDIASIQQITQDREIESDNVVAVYSALTRRISNLMDASVCGVLLYDSRRELLVGQPPFSGLPDQLITIANIPVGERAAAHHIWQQQDYWISNDLADDEMIDGMGLRGLVDAAGLRNLALVTMRIGRQRIGMMLLANKSTLTGFTSRDVQNLRILVAQAAIVVENVRLFERERRQDTELVGLQEITHAIGALSSEDEIYVFSDINTRIAKLMNIEMCGVLLYDPSQKRLVAQLPFYGVADEMIADYEIDLTRNEVMEELWEEQEYWYTNRAKADTLVFSAGLADMAERVDVEKTLFASLTAGGAKIGVIQVSNKFSGEDFTDSDARLLMIFATQAAAIIENARLVREVKRRAEEADRLRVIAERSSNIVTLEQSLAPVLSEVSYLMNVRLVFLSILQEKNEQLVTHPRAVFGTELDEPIRYSVQDAEFKDTVTYTQAPLVLDNATTHRAYSNMAAQMHFENLAIVPMMIGERSLGELGIANRLRDSYTPDDLRLLYVVASQLASTVERVRLFDAAGESLEQRVQELSAISHVTEILNTTIELNTILEVIRQEASMVLGATDSSIVLLRDINEWDKEVPQRVALRLGDIGTSNTLAEVERQAIAKGVVLVNDYYQSDLKPVPANARSAMAVSFSYAEIPVGVIHIHAERAGMFDERNLSFVETLSAKASLAYGTSVRYYEQMTRSQVMRQRVEQLNQIFELGQMLQTNVDPNMMLEAIAYSIVQSVGFDVVVITMVDQERGVLHRVTQAGLPVDVFERSKSDVLPLNQLDGLLKSELRISESYFYPIEIILDWQIAGLDALSAAFVGNRTLSEQGENAWNDGDMLLVPITGANSELLGIISLDRPQDNLRPDRAKIEILEIFAHQAATTIENNRLYVSSLRSAEQEAQLNAMLEAIASTLDTDSILETVANNVLGMGIFQTMDVALTMEDNSPGYTLTHIEAGDTPTTPKIHKTRKATLEHTALGRSMRNSAEYVYTRQNDISSYKDLTEWYQQGERVSLVLPLSAGGEMLGAIHFGSYQDRNADSADFKNLLARVAKLTAVAIQNARLFNQAVNLQSFNESIVESIQQGIVVLDRSGRVISFNQSMQDEYDWNPDSRLRDLFDYLPDLTDALSPPLREVLEHGEPQQVLNLRTPYGNGYRMRSFYMYPLISGGAVNGAVMLVEDVTERVRLEENVQARANQLAALTRASGRITSTLKRDEVIEIVLEVMEDIVPHDTITLWRRDDIEYMQLIGAKGFPVSLSPPIRVRIGGSQRLNHIVENQTLLTVDDLPHFLRAYSHTLPGDVGAGSWMGVPLLYQGSVIGMIAVAKHETSFYTPQAEQGLFAFANQVAVAFTNADLFTETAARTERLSLLNRVSLALVQSMDTENIFEIALTEIANALRAEKSRAILFDPNNEVGRVIVDFPRSEATPTQRIGLRNSAVFSYITERLQPLVYSHNRANMPEDLADEIHTELEQRGLKDYLLVPMVAPGHVIGAFEFETRTATLLLGPETLETGLIIANQTAIAIQNANQLEETTSRTRELETLLEAAQSTSLTMDLKEVFKTVTDLFISALDTDDCAIMIWDDLEGVLVVEYDVNRKGDPTRVSPKGTRIELSRYPMRLQSLRNREVLVAALDDPNIDKNEREELILQKDQARMFVPLVVRDQSIGIIQVEVSDPNRRITEQERRLARALGAQVAIAIENARLSTEASAQMDELFIINDLSQAIASKIDIESMLTIVRDQVPGVTGARQLYVALYDKPNNRVSFPLAVADGKVYEVPTRPFGTDEVSFIIRNRRPLLLGSDYFEADDVRRSLNITNGEGDVKSYLGVPLIVGDEVVGVLAVRDEERTRMFGLNDQRILTTVGSQLGAALQNARLFQQIQGFADELNSLVQDRTEELQEERDRLDMLYQITAELALTLDMDRVLNRALQMMASAVKAHDGVIMLIDPMTDRLYNRASLSRVVSQDEDMSHPAEMLATWLIHNEHELLVDDLHQEEFWNPSIEGAEEWRSAMAVLLETNEDVQGVLVLLSRDIAAFPEPLLNLVIAAANQVASAINNADLYQLIRDQAERLGTLLRTEQEEAEKSNAILEGIADGVMLTDSQGQISLFNSAAEEMLALPRMQVMGRTLDELVDEYGQNVRRWAQPIMAWTSQDVNTRGAFPAERLELDNHVLSVNISPVYSGTQYLGAVSVFRDVTRDVEVDNMKNQFVLNVSHELRTPLTSIKGYADLALMTGKMSGLTDDQLSSVSVIKTNADRLTMLVEDLLTIARIDAGESRMNIEPVNMAEVIEIQLKNAQDRHYEKQHRVEVNLLEGLPIAALDRRKVMQVVSNIIDNAFNYTPTGGNIKIDLKYDPQRDKHLLLSVQDNGLGIPQEFQARVWERFSKHDEHAIQMNTAGTGLGLPIVKELVTMHDGEVWFESREGVGTTFYVSLPFEYQRAASHTAQSLNGGDIYNG